MSSLMRGAVVVGCVLNRRVAGAFVALMVLFGAAEGRADVVDGFDGAPAAEASVVSDADDSLREAMIARIRDHLLFVPSFLLGQVPLMVPLPRDPLATDGEPGGVGSYDEAAASGPLAAVIRPKLDLFKGFVAPEIMTDRMGPYDSGALSPAVVTPFVAQKDIGVGVSGGNDLLTRLLTRPWSDYSFEDVSMLFVGLFCVLVFLVLYMTPFLVGRARRVPGSDFLLVLNIFVGWTVIGWILCLFWASHRTERGAAGLKSVQRT